ncbi:NADP(H)-dependent aldo-keto reductase [Paraferrimonas haliotis]|uniref:Protein tas n=1 Tax=Paraferrimonas haliotis TaxID=2013866 RepID=A0AA37TV82_9GAMM|nr:NADP(H)-dependent aldo-keto reductase [Paraferrimonas haliotis]GLS82421.1 aldo/keto reductase [Paraferrimonas haliotis]
MQLSKLGRSSLNVSPICLGSMTWGAQNTQAQAFEQIDYAISRGINFIDTAEMYPVPPTAQTQGDTETIIGNYLQQRSLRNDLVIATKVAAPGGCDYIREDMHLNWRSIHQACEDSLRRLQVDCIDLYQVHWPDRVAPRFGEMYYHNKPSQQQTPILETLDALSDLVKQGKVRYLGISNETPWGAMKYLQLAQQHGLERIVSIQNPYNLLNRSFEMGLAEVALQEELPLLAYSPLAFGTLTGKYQQGAKPEGARLTLFDRFVRYTGTPASLKAIDDYVTLANDHQLSPAQMALAFVNQQSFVGSNIIGATTLSQLQHNIDSLSVHLTDKVLQEIVDLGEQHRIPCP